MAISSLETTREFGFSHSSLHLRETAEIISNSPQLKPKPLHLSSLSRAGLNSLEHKHTHLIPREILSPQHKPFVIIDLDDTVWPHVQHLVKAVSEASGTPISMEYFQTIGHTRKIPEWKNNSETMTLHDQIVAGDHPDYYPYVNIADTQAVAAINAVHQMGHLYCFLTARPSQLFSLTQQLLAQNHIPHVDQSEAPDATTHSLPRKGSLYCAHSELAETSAYKTSVTTQWSTNLHAEGWLGPLIIIDDLLSPFSSLLESGKAQGIALSGPLNYSLPLLPNETRAESWPEINELLTNIHQNTISQEQNDWRLFQFDDSLPDHLLVVNKKDSGNGEFELPEVRWQLITREDWENNPYPVLASLGLKSKTEPDYN